jgi:hypothetical protein
MLRRRHIDADRGNSRLRAMLAAAARPFRALGWGVQERLLWPLRDLAGSVGELLRWPFQRLGWGIERRFVWPSRERVASWGLARRIAGGGAMAALAIGATALGVLLAAQEEPADQPVAIAPPSLIADPQPAQAERPAGPALQGAPPVFGVGSGVRVTTSKGGGKESAAPQADATEETDPSAAAEQTDGGESGAEGATASSQKPMPAGPAAMKVARRFSEAFIFYEVGEKPARAKAIFAETATPRLATALAERPPRLPLKVKVPKAKVLNLVPGPRKAKAYTVSVSLLRVGVTSELKLKMKRRKGAWVITDVRG